MKLLSTIWTWSWRIVFLAFVVIFAIAFKEAFFDNSQPPKADKALFAIQSYSGDGNGKLVPSRVYYTNSLTNEGTTPRTVGGYWWFDGKQYKHSGKERLFTEPIKVVKR